MAFRMVSSSMPDPVTIMRRSGRVALRLAIRSKRFWPLRLPSRIRSMPCKLPMSGREAEINSKSTSLSNRALNPTNRSGSLSTTAIRIGDFFTGAVFAAIADFIAFLLGVDGASIAAFVLDGKRGNGFVITAVTWETSYRNILIGEARKLMRLLYRLPSQRQLARIAVFLVAATLYSA